MLRFLTRMLMVTALFLLPIGCDGDHSHDHSDGHSHDHSHAVSPTQASHENAGGNAATGSVEATEGDGGTTRTELPATKSTVAGMPDIPVLTGDFAKDKAALVAAIDTLTKAWDKNKAEYETLLKDKKLKPEDPRLATLRSNDSEYKKVAGVLHQLYDELKGE